MASSLRSELGGVGLEHRQQRGHALGKLLLAADVAIVNFRLAAGHRIELDGPFRHLGGKLVRFLIKQPRSLGR